MSIVVLLEHVPLAQISTTVDAPLPPEMDTVRTPKPSRLELHKTYVKHVVIICPITSNEGSPVIRLVVVLAWFLENTSVTME
jgi:hypothetical protein